MSTNLPLPIREQGYYWIELINDPNSEMIAFYGGYEGYDPDTQSRRIYKYGWTDNSELGDWEDHEVKVLSGRIKAPSEQ